MVWMACQAIPELHRHRGDLLDRDFTETTGVHVGIVVAQRTKVTSNGSMDFVVGRANIEHLSG